MFITLTVIPKATDQNPNAATFPQLVNPRAIARFNRSVTGEARTVVYMVDGSIVDVVETPEQILCAVLPPAPKKKGR